MKEERLPNGTILAEFSISEVTRSSKGNYYILVQNKIKTMRLDVEIYYLTPHGSDRLGGIEQMVIIICTAVGLVFGALLIGVYFKRKKLYEARRDDEERRGLLSGNR